MRARRTRRSQGRGRWSPRASSRGSRRGGGRVWRGSGAAALSAAHSPHHTSALDTGTAAIAVRLTMTHCFGSGYSSGSNYNLTHFFSSNLDSNLSSLELGLEFMLGYWVRMGVEWESRWDDYGEAVPYHFCAVHVETDLGAKGQDVVRVRHLDSRNSAENALKRKKN